MDVDLDFTKLKEAKRMNNMIYRCDFCGRNKEVKRTYYGSGFKYVRLICSDCQKELNAEIIQPKKEEAKE